MKKIILFIIIFFCYSKSVCQKKETTSLGIPNFTILGNAQDVEKYKWLEVGFSESLTDAFSRISEFSLIERNQFIKIINEQNLQNTKQIDTSSVVKAGKILGVKQILIGSCQIITGHTLVNMRIVNVETGEIKPLKNLPTIVTPIDSILFLQKRLCVEVLKQFQVKNEHEMITQIETATSKSTNNIKAYEFLNKGSELYNNGQFNEAIEMYNHALSIDKKYNKAYFKRGQSKFAINQYNKAIEDYKKTGDYIRKDSIYQLISEVYFKQGLKKKSYEYIMMAKKLNPNNTALNKMTLELEKTKLVDKPIYNNNTPYETIFEFNDGIARVKKDEKYGFIDLNNNIVIPLIFDDLRDFKNDLAATKTNGKWGFIDKKGNFVINPKYNDVSDFDKNNLAKVLLKLKWGIINKSGKTIIPIDFENSAYTYPSWESKEYIEVCKYTGLMGINEVCGVYNNNGAEVLPIIYDELDNLNEYESYYGEKKYNYIHASLNKKWGVVNLKNEIIVPFTYSAKDCIRKFKNGFAAVKINERWGFVNTKGVLIIPTIYEKVNDYNGITFEVRIKGKWGAVNINNIHNIPCEYENFEYIKKNYFAAQKNNKWGLIDLNNNIVCEFKFDKMSTSIDGHNYIRFTNSSEDSITVNVELNGKRFWISEKCKCISDCN